MTEAGAAAGCVFCAIVRGEAPASFVYRDDETVAFMDIRPIQTGHTLVVPRRHAPLMRDFDDRLLQQVWSVAMQVYGALRVTLPMDGLNLVVADGAAANQEVPHVHVHLVPRHWDDGFGFRFPPGYGTMPPRAELDATAERIRAAIA